MALQAFFEVIRSALHRLPTTLVVGSGGKRVVAPLLLVLLLGGTVGGAFAGTLILPCLALEMVEDCSDRLFS